AGWSNRPNRPEIAPLFGLKTRDLAGKTRELRRAASGRVHGTRMAEFPKKTPKKITDDPDGALVLIRRLGMEQSVGYWPRYLLAFFLMAVAAGATAAATYVLGQVINQAYVDKNVMGIAMLSGVTVLLLFIKGVATYGHMVILSKISNAILANNQRQLF